MNFAAAVIKVRKSKYIEKNCKFEMLYLQKGFGDLARLFSNFRRSDRVYLG